MVLKIFRGVWFVSSLSVLAALLVVYASLPDRVFIMQDGLDYLSVTREAFFYIALGIITLINALVYVVKTLFEKEEALRTWFHGLIITVNIFLIFTLFFFSVFNSTERFDFHRIGVFIYGSVILVGLWSLIWPCRLVLRKFLHKPTV